MKQVGPLLIVRPDAAGQLLYPILPVPFRQMVQEVGHRLIQLDIVGVHIAVDVLVPALHALRQCPHRDGVAGFLCQVLIVEAVSRPDTVFGHAPHYVLTQFVVRIEKHVNLHHE